MSGQRKVKVDRVTEHNRRMWERLAKAGIPYTRPQGRPPRTRTGLRRFLDPQGRLRGVRLAGARVLVLAGGGGWDAVVFAKLEAETTLFDISRRQLGTVRGLARRTGVRIRFAQGTIKDLSRFREGSFDVIWHCHWLVFVDDARRVLREVGRVLAPGGTYVMSTVHATTMRLYGTFRDDGWQRPDHRVRPPLRDDHQRDRRRRHGFRRALGTARGSAGTPTAPGQAHPRQCAAPALPLSGLRPGALTQAARRVDTLVERSYTASR